MAHRYDPTEYLYVSARIRALELHLTTKEQWSRMESMDSAAEIMAVYSDKKAANDTTIAEDTLREAFAAVAESVPDKSLLLFLQYPYDCNNIKALEKCRRLGIDPSDLLIDLGSISTKTLLTVSENELFLLLPHHMAAALTEAREAFDKTGDPREIDFLLDRAAFADMKEAAAPFPFAAELVRIKIELANLMLCDRLLRMPEQEIARNLLERAALSCENFDREKLIELFDGGTEAFAKAIAGTPYADVFAPGSSPAEVEKRADDLIAGTVRRARTVTFGVEVPIAYLMALENECQNLRILLAAKDAGLDDAAVKARMRTHYV
ncbi:MAG: V-type ATPase subunit [Clostridia bacterium]|nr:V-type ATPase subunit [Clostridia bacterium]